MMTKIEWYAKTILGITLFPAQVEFIKAISEGKIMASGRKAGVTTATKVVREYLKEALKTTGDSSEQVAMVVEAVANDPHPHIWQPLHGNGELFNRAAVAHEITSALVRDARLHDDIKNIEIGYKVKKHDSDGTITKAELTEISLMPDTEDKK